MLVVAVAVDSLFPPLASRLLNTDKGVKVLFVLSIIAQMCTAQKRLANQRFNFLN